MADGFLTNSLLIILPSGKEYYYKIAKPDENGKYVCNEKGEIDGSPDIEAIIMFHNNIVIRRKSGGPIVWLIPNLAAFSHDKEMVALQTEPAEPDPTEVPVNLIPVPPSGAIPVPEAPVPA